MVDREQLGAGAAGKFVEIRRDRDIFEQAADRAGAVERSLRAAQDLDPGEVVGQQVDREIAAFGIGRDRPDRRIVDIDADGGVGAERRDAAQGDAGAARRSAISPWRPGT